MDATLSSVKGVDSASIMNKEMGTKRPGSPTLGDQEIFDLVCDYLRSRRYFRAARALQLEREECDNGENGNVPDTQAASRLESLLERSWVTSLICDEPADYNPFKRAKRDNLDGYLPPDNEGVTEPNNRELSVATRIVSIEGCKDDPYGASNMPIYQTATFGQPSASTFGVYDYTRSGNPTRAALEAHVAQLEAGHRAFAFTSGMAAISAVARLVKSGEEIILSDDSYGGTYRLVSQILTGNGVVVKYVDLSGATGPDNLRKALRQNTRLVMMESPTNPMQRVCDMQALADAAHEVGALISVDNTMMSPILQQPLKHGVDIVIHSATKFMNGHADTMSGVVVVKNQELAEKVYFVQNAEGTGLAPFDSWLLLRGIKTMAIRVEKAQENAREIATFLHKHKAITQVYYPGLTGTIATAIHSKQAKGTGAVVSFRTGSLPLSQHIVSNTKLFRITVSFGSTNSTISLPGVMSHASIPEEVRKAREFPEDLIRLAVGIEDAQDLIRDLKEAIDSY